MTNINLLPWREHIRQERKRQFIYIYFGTVLTVIVLLFVAQQFFRHNINIQQERNAYLKEVIHLLDQHNAEIKELKEQKVALMQKMDLIQTLQNQRPLIVHFFDEIVNILPHGLYLTNLQKIEEQVMIEGLTESNTYISSLMRNIETSRWLQNPTLIEIKAEEKNSQKDTVFKMSFQMVRKTNE